MGNQPKKQPILKNKTMASDECEYCQIMFRSKEPSVVFIFDVSQSHIDYIVDVGWTVTPWGVKLPQRMIPCLHNHNMYKSILRYDIIYPKMLALYKWLVRRRLENFDIFWYITGMLDKLVA